MIMSMTDDPGSRFWSQYNPDMEVPEPSSLAGGQWAAMSTKTEGASKLLYQQ